MISSISSVPTHAVGMIVAPFFIAIRAKPSLSVIIKISMNIGWKGYSKERKTKTSKTELMYSDEFCFNHLSTTTRIFCLSMI